MKKIKSLLFKQDINELTKENGYYATRKWDGAACAIIDKKLYKRYDCKRGKTPPIGAIACQLPDETTGHWPHWVLCVPNEPSDKYFWEGFDNFLKNYKKIKRRLSRFSRSFELCGPKVNGNREKFDKHYLIPHGLEDEEVEKFNEIGDYSLEAIKKFLEEHKEMEGLVFYNKYFNPVWKIKLKHFELGKEGLKND